MSCDSCNQTNIDCTCPDPNGIAGARIENIVSTDSGVSHAITGLGYTMTLYTNTSSNTQRIFSECNMNITANAVHQITTTYLVNGVAASGSSILIQNQAIVKTDHTHFLTATDLAPGDVLSINVQSTDAAGSLTWLVSFIYKYDL